MTIDRWKLDLKLLKDYRGFSPVNWDCSESECIVGTLNAVNMDAKSLIINGHVDVVPVAGSEGNWSASPFESYVKDGRLYGRGSGDMKGGIVAAMTALLALRKLGYRPAGRLHFETVPEEENSGNGALACCVRGYKADACIIPEPFDGCVTTGQVGVMWMTVSLDGKPAHVLDTRAGCSAIEGSYKIFETLKQTEVSMNQKKHPAFASIERPINFSLGTIEGGNWPSSVASFCKFQVRIGAYPEMDLPAYQKELEKVVMSRADELGIKAKVEWFGFHSEGYVADPSHPLFSEMCDSFNLATGREAKRSLLTCTTDCRTFQLYYGIPSTCLGPRAERIHGIDECVDLKSLQEVAMTYAIFIQKWCGLVKL